MVDYSYLCSGITVKAYPEAYESVFIRAKYIVVKNVNLLARLK
jgi:hypothetical protein